MREMHASRARSGIRSFVSWSTIIPNFFCLFGAWDGEALVLRIRKNPPVRRSRQREGLVFFLPPRGVCLPRELWGDREYISPQEKVICKYGRDPPLLKKKKILRSLLHAKLAIERELSLWPRH